MDKIIINDIEFNTTDVENLVALLDSDDQRMMVLRTILTNDYKIYDANLHGSGEFNNPIGMVLRHGEMRGRCFVLNGILELSKTLKESLEILKNNKLDKIK